MRLKPIVTTAAVVIALLAAAAVLVIRSFGPRELALGVAESVRAHTGRELSFGRR